MKKRTGQRVAACVALLLALLVVVGCRGNPEKRKRAYFDAGHAYMHKGRYPEASIEFRKALQLDPRFTDAQYLLAQAYMGSGDWSRAYSALQRTIELEPGHLEAHLDLGRIYAAWGQYERAEAEGSLVLERDPHNPTGYQLMGASLMGLRDRIGAVAAFGKLVELMPKDPSARIDLALSQVYVGRYAEAESNLRHAIQIDPHFTQAYDELAGLYRLRGKIPAAERVSRGRLGRNQVAVTSRASLGEPQPGIY